MSRSTGRDIRLRALISRTKTTDYSGDTSRRYISNLGSLTSWHSTFGGTRVSGRRRFKQPCGLPQTYESVSRTTTRKNLHSDSPSSNDRKIGRTRNSEGLTNGFEMKCDCGKRVSACLCRITKSTSHFSRSSQHSAGGPQF